MQIIYSKENIVLNGSVVALGNFDGVHLGHTALIKKARKLAKNMELPLCVYTFGEHPSGFLSNCSGKENTLITNNDEKQKILEELGVDILYYEDFSAVCNMNSADFCKKILIDTLSCKIAVCGGNFSFGKDKEGTCEVLKCELEKLGAQAVIADYVKVSGEKVNSTKIREHIKNGEIEKASALLGRPFSIYYPVVHGRHLGTKMGIPTINQAFEKTKLKPKNGVYACLCYIDGKKYLGVADVGKKPTVTENTELAPILCETHIIDFCGDLYGKSIKIDFYTRLRDEKKFASLSELTEEIKRNITTTRKYFENEKGITKDEQ